MYIFNLAQRLIYNKPLLHIFLIIQFTVSFFVLECAISTLSLNISTGKFLKEILNSNFCYFSVAERNTSIDESGNLVFNNSNICFEDYLCGLDAVMQHEYIHMNLESEDISLQLQPEKIVQKTTGYMYSGHIFNEKNKEADVIRVITNNKTLKSNTCYRAVLTDFNDTQVEATIKIVGILGEPSYILSATTGGSEISSANIACIADEDRDGAFTYIGCAEDYEALFENKLKHPINKNTLLLFSDTISQDEMQKNINILKTSGVVATSDNILQATKDGNLFVLKTYLPTFIFLFLVAVSGMIAVSIINIYDQINTLSLYSILGCSYKNIKKIIHCYISVLCIIPLLITWLILMLSQQLNALSGYFLTISAINYVLPVFICLFIYLTVPFVPIFSFNKQSLAHLQRKF